MELHSECDLNRSLLTQVVSIGTENTVGMETNVSYNHFISRSVLQTPFFFNLGIIEPRPNCKDFSQVSRLKVIVDRQQKFPSKQKLTYAASPHRLNIRRHHVVYKTYPLVCLYVVDNILSAY